MSRDPHERRARERAGRLCEALRARADALSLDAAAEIEGTLDAFAGLVAGQRCLREKLGNTERNLRLMHDLWGRVPAEERVRAAHRGSAT